jgi:hypothetical protein
MALAVVSGVDYIGRAWPVLTGADGPKEPPSAT